MLIVGYFSAECQLRDVLEPNRKGIHVYPSSLEVAEWVSFQLKLAHAHESIENQHATRLDLTDST